MTPCRRSLPHSGGPAVTIDGNEYDNLFVLTLCRCRWQGIGLSNLQYGVASP